jgi:integral membrane protein (TIGR00529 family)
MLNVLGVVIAFLFIIILIRKKINFGLSLILGSLILGIFSLQEINLIDIPKAFSKAIIYDFDKEIFDFQTIELAFLLSLIFILAKCMQETGMIKKLINSLRSIFTKGGTLAIIPAVYGLMPVPGGALFSAPTIDEEGDKFQIDNNQKNFLNVWFRHIWFPIYPISSAMILITSEKFADFDISLIIIANIPAFIASIVIGLYYLKKFIKKIPKQKNKIEKNYSGLIYLLPPILPIFFYGFLQTFGIPQIRSFLIGIFISIFLVFYLANGDKNEYFQIFKRSISFNLAFTIFGIMIFRELFTISNANFVIKDIIVSAHIPTIFIIILIPLILGLLTGYNLGSVALSYPILTPFFPSNISLLIIVGFASLIFISSLVGYIISPIHLCNVLSSNYLKTDTTRMYKTYIPASIAMLTIQTIVICLVFYFSGFLENFF